MGPVEVHLEEDAGLHTGAFQITGRMREGEGGSGAGSIVLPTGDRFTLSESIIPIGRHPESKLVLAASNVSRKPAEHRLEERRVWKECGRKVRSRMSPGTKKK